MRTIIFTKGDHEIKVELNEFQVYLTVEDFGCVHEEALMPLDKDMLVCTGFTINGKPFGVQPPTDTMKDLRKAKEEEKALFRNAAYTASHDEIARRKAEKEWDSTYNEGGYGYNPYRSESYNKTEPMYKGDENPE